MKEVPERGRGRTASQRDRVARAVFAEAEARGITDRRWVERLIAEVLQRLEIDGGDRQPLPGMEDLVPHNGKRPPPRGTIKAIVGDILSQKTAENGGEGVAQIELTTQVKDERREVSPSPEITIAPLGANAVTVLERRYLRKDKHGKVTETPEQMFRRVARNMAAAELIYDPEADISAWEEKFFHLMTSLDFLPNSPTLMNAGGDLQQLSACFVLPVEDSIESIFSTIKSTALIHKSGGGTGFSFSRIRPARDRVMTTGGIASGPVSFIRVFDAATDAVKQGGTRRGANMAILNVEHPDIMDFITSKEKGDSLQNFNISVAVTERFMEAVERGEDYDLINPRQGRVVRRLNAKMVFDKMVEMAWRNGDPGIVFLDRINRDNPTPHLGAIESTNPCGEQPLLPFESCNLGSINLSYMIRGQDGRREVDYEKLGHTVHLAVRFLDNVIDMNRYPLPDIEERTKSTRKIGLGVMGFADMLILLGVPYNSPEALMVAEEVMGFISREATQASAALAEERGVFPAFSGSIYDAPGMPRVRNATRTTIAPTGTLSIIANCSSGIEPIFALSYYRHILDNDRLVEVHPYFLEVAQREGFYREGLVEELAQGKCLQEMEDIPAWARRLFVTAHDIAPEWHVKVQAAFQRHTDNAVSKTINFPHQATVEDVARAYWLAYREGCKGITIYRDRSRDRQVLATEVAVGDTVERKEAARIVPRRRPRKTTGTTEKVSTGCGNLYITVNSDEKGICEVFSSLGKSGGCASAQLEATSRLVSLALRSGVELESVVEQLKGIRCPSIAWDEGQSVLSCSDAIGGVLERHLRQGAQVRKEAQTPVSISDSSKADVRKWEPAANVAGQCPECSTLLVYAEGCYICPGCGYTKCG
ncbi:MAG: vitamin B12-dependent ribonucleotide reductase [Chloroflexi bacterium]|nr:vitamin B12-dependent ribonucleotide reductase [Chloroflexota bacterium]